MYGTRGGYTGGGLSHSDHCVILLWEMCGMYEERDWENKLDINLFAPVNEDGESVYHTATELK